MTFHIVFHMRGFFFSITFLFFFFSCHEESHKPGICLSFDDRSIKEWYLLRNLFKQHQAQVTFYVTQFDSLSREEIEMLKELQNDGHEIGSHGALHIQAEDYIKKKSYKEYIANEINQSILQMKGKGFDPITFAYPYGSSYWFTDFIILKKFKMIRNVSSSGNKKEIPDDAYFKFNGNKKVSAIGIDYPHQPSKEMLVSAMIRAEQENKVLLLFGHQPVKSGQTDYTFDIESLAWILDQAHRHHLSFYRVADLASE